MPRCAGAGWHEGCRPTKYLEVPPCTSCIANLWFAPITNSISKAQRPRFANSHITPPGIFTTLNGGCVSTVRLRSMLMAECISRHLSTPGHTSQAYMGFRETTSKRRTWTPHFQDTSGRDRSDPDQRSAACDACFHMLRTGWEHQHSIRTS